VGQQPNVQLGMEDLPRPVRHPAAARRWTPSRPGDLGSPAAVPWGGAFGTPGPDTGYALRILASREWSLGPREDRHDVEAGVAAIMSARASRLGRAPVVADAEVAEMLLGLRAEDLPGEAVSRLRERRLAVLPGIAHRVAAQRALVASVRIEFLTADANTVRGEVGAGSDPFAP
jgi:hypothetical protein